ncbi:FtsX-like permease family protein [Oleiagrimonas sp. C23AA]|uniref:FtsX-like permease family protein n=1 Tax=Oleiagrimonas sp. C23AA TaxID=2719047 RepID=UPI0014246BC6|nr:FtsX-like permease family protein [Oleiagrimonas sp. C23AA]NII09867.1 FtsX-like permease family protein [Oleiagrimonas sp. C23AA]
MNLKAAQDFDVEGLVWLARGTSLAALRQQLASLQSQLDPLIHGAHRARQLTAKPLGVYAVHEDIRRWVGLMFAAGCLVLLLACMNVANLQLVQVLSRRHELALQGALGCSRSRLLMEALLGSVWLSAAALLVALPIMHGCSQWLIQIYADNDQALSSFTQRGVGAPVLGFVVVMALLCAAMAAVIPVWRVSREDISGLLRDGSKGSASGFARVARVLVVAEIALTVVLLTGAGTLVKTLRQILAQPAAGQVAPERILTARLAFPVSNGGNAHQVESVLRLTQHLRDDPAVAAVTLANLIPEYDYGSDEYIAAQGQPKPAQGWVDAHTGMVDQHFLATYGVPLLKGRFFGAQDDATSAPVAVIDTVTAQRLWPGREALGQTLVLHPEAHVERFKVIGVIPPLRATGPFDPPQPEVLLAWRQMAGDFSVQSLAIRTKATQAESYLPSLRRRVQQVLPQVAVYRAFSQARLEQMDRLGLRVLSQVFSVLGAVALGLAGLGLYGVLAFSVAQRTREIGIRRAIGAGHQAIIAQVAQRLVWQAGLGLLMGLALAWPWTSLLARSALPMQPHDLTVFALSVAVILLAMALATWLPLRHALRVDPAVALRYE